MGARLVVAGTHSGVGKTTVAVGLMAALRRRGLRVAPAKVGPDFIDPGYHEVATGRTGRNLDTFLNGPESVAAAAALAASGADLLVVEGVMGLFDGVGATDAASTAEVARLLEAPVVLVVDAASMSGSVVALVDGYHRHLQRVRGTGVAGLVLNRVGSPTHEAILREALAGGEVPVLGALRRDPALQWRDRHLGLVPVVEDRAAVATSVGRLADAVARTVDLAAVERLARSAPPLQAPERPPARRVAPAPVPVAVVSGPSFSFSYPDNLERLAEAGAELVPFDPLTDPALPQGARALYACGGFPEVFAEQLAANEPLRRDVAAGMAQGMVTWAECGGLLWLAASLDGHRLCGAIPADATMTGSVTVGYRRATCRRDSPIAPAGTQLRGHELHYSRLDPPGDALELEGRAGRSRAGWAGPTLFASYLHLHLGWDTAPAERFMAAATGHRGALPPSD
ncbi:MAG TPA: cobyrinate a,c-diamide synthase [Acidimicrobiales bacterium]|nr:cobyrinate a,c-diamide synthase [Acidimicrobiales bacterium]